MNKMNTERVKREQSFHDNEVGKKNVRKPQSIYYGNLMGKHVYRQREIGNIQDKIVLDYGCGVGDAAIKYLQRGAIVYAIDISPVLIEKLQNKAREFNLHQNLHAYAMNAEKLEFHDNFFDLVIGDGILHHLNVEKSCTEIKRVLKSNGKAIFTEPLGTNPIINFYRKITPKSRTIDEKPFNHEDFSIIKKHFSNASFEFFELSTLIPMFLATIKFKKLSQVSRPFFEKVDRKLLSIKMFQKLSWMTVITMKK